jgi:hypothetical protein
MADHKTKQTRRKTQENFNFGKKRSEQKKSLNAEVRLKMKN